MDKILENRAHNFTGGPAMTSEKIIEKISEQVLNYNGTGVSLLELGHRTEEFDKIERDSANSVKKLLHPEFPATHEVIWMTGGATAQFAATVLNLYKGPQHPICFVISGTWSRAALDEARKLGAKCEVILEVDADIPPEKHLFDLESKIELLKNCSYVYYCDNETVVGVEFAAAGAPFSNRISSWLDYLPEQVPIVCDMTSNIATRPFDVSRYAVIFAGAQKNLGTSGVTVVIVNKNLILSLHDSKSLALTPPITLDMAIQINNNSTYNTPPILPIYSCLIYTQYLLDKGGLTSIINTRNDVLKLIDTAVTETRGFYVYCVPPHYRSRSNISLRICPNRNGVPCEKLEASAPIVAKQQFNIIGINAHKTFKGLRISIYNYVTIQNAIVLCNFLRSFASNPH